MNKNILLLCACASLIAVAWGEKQTTAGVCGPISGQAFNCPKFGFSYQIPLGWVARTAEMQQPAPEEAPTEKSDGAEDSGGSQDKPGSQPSSPSNANIAKSQTLLAIFERPPQASGQTINSAVIIAAESRADYPQVKTAADYFAVIGDLAEAGGLKAAGDPYAFTAGGRQLVREDFQGEHGKLPVFQSTLVILEKGQIVSFTFVTGSGDEVEQLISTLRFSRSNSSTPLR